jgi:hypothetical protein
MILKCEEKYKIKIIDVSICVERFSLVIMTLLINMISDILWLTLKLQNFISIIKEISFTNEHDKYNNKLPAKQGDSNA